MAPIEPNEYRYHADNGLYAAVTLLSFVGLLLFASAISAVWGVAALLQAGWLEMDGLPVGNYVFWGVAFLVAGTLQAGTALLLLFDTRIGIVLGVALAVLNMIVQASVIAVYPIWSILGIAINLNVIYVLLVLHAPAQKSRRHA